MRVDASAALGVIQRRGVAKICHLQTGSLWIQEQQLRDVLAFHKTPGVDNIADMFTKNLPRQVCETHMKNLGCSFESGRAEVAAQLHRINKKVERAQECLFRDQDASNGTGVTEEIQLDWSGIESHCIESLIHYVEGKKDEVMSEAQDRWARRVSREVMESETALRSTEHADVKDHWGYSKTSNPADRVWTRHHTKPRCAFFTPCQTNGGPASSESLVGTRITIGTFDDGEDVLHVDSWKDRTVAHKKSKSMWTSTTFFHEGHKSRGQQGSVEPTCPAGGVSQ